MPRQVEIFVLFCFLTAHFVPFSSYSQSGISPVGGDIISENGSLSYTVGQVTWKSLLDDSCSAAQGVQHAYDVYPLGVVSSNDKEMLKVFPNPTTNEIFIVDLFDQFTDIKFQLTKLTGEIILNGKNGSCPITIDMSDLSLGTYVLQLIEIGGYSNQSFMIIKN